MGAGEKERACPRIGCLTPSAEETIQHATVECLVVTTDWNNIAKHLRWPYLAHQSWETVVSGLEPGEGYGCPGEKWLKGTLPPEYICSPCKKEECSVVSGKAS